MKIPVDSISKNPPLTPAADFMALRRQGIALIEQLASAQWSDYNSHDPGITLLESLCYAITDLSYRSQWPIADLLTTPGASADQPYPDQAFFSAREILSVNPVTRDDWRRLLIDLDQVRNAWVDDQPCACDFGYYAECSEQQLHLRYQALTQQASPIEVRGLYDVLVELEDDPELGDLNAHCVQAGSVWFDNSGQGHSLCLELRYPRLATLSGAELALLDAAASGSPALVTVELLSFADNKSYNLLDDQDKIELERDDYLQNRWHRVLYLDLQLRFADGSSLTLANTTLRLFANQQLLRHCSFAWLREQLQKATRDGLLPRLLRKRRAGQQTLEQVKRVLNQRRNLAEDFRRVKVVEVEEIAVCADIEVKADADIELIQAKIWLLLEQFCSPPMQFDELHSLLQRGTAVEDIFNGPALNNGFVSAEQLRAAQLPGVLRTSDLLNRLMDIDGLISVNNLLLTQYDSEGQPLNATQQIEGNGLSASWQIQLPPLHQPRFHRQLSRLLFYKNGLPFQARMDEALATLRTLRARQLRPKLGRQTSDTQDLPLPRGQSRDATDYWPMQYALPPLYGIGPEGLPADADSRRHAQARQLKGYLLVFEQLLANAQAQIDHCRALFSLNPEVSRSYFVKLLNEQSLVGYANLVNELEQQQLESLTESADEFVQRRNRFLDHLLARFGESFSEYALVLSRPQGWLAGEQRLIEDKLSFLRNYPTISHDRYRSFDRRSPTLADYDSGLEQRVALLLGFPSLHMLWQEDTDHPSSMKFRLNDGYRDWLRGQFPLLEGEQRQKLEQRVLLSLCQSEHYRLETDEQGFQLQLLADNGELLASSAQSFAEHTQALALRDELLSWGNQRRSVVVEHILLRPKFPGDALYPLCTDSCSPCEADPYSFRLSWVMPGWTAPFNGDLELRSFAERSIRRETPAHVLPKVCWLSNDGFEPDQDIIAKLTTWLLSGAVKTAEGAVLTRIQAAEAADKLYRHLRGHFTAWYAQQQYRFYPNDTLATTLTTMLAEMSTDVQLGAAVLDELDWTAVRQDCADYFQHLLRKGWQFERFQQGWQQWLQADRQFDWQGNSIAEEVQSLLKSRLVNGSAQQLSELSRQLLNDYGQHFHNWLQSKFVDRVIPQPWVDNEFHDFAPLPVQLSRYASPLLFTTDPSEALQTLLDHRYQGFREVAYALQQLLLLLADINSTYPPATLHDYDDGSDQNPVRLSRSTLG